MVKIYCMVFLNNKICKKNKVILVTVSLQSFHLTLTFMEESLLSA